MRHRGRIGAAVGIGLAVLAGPASASTYCQVSGAFSACASATISVNGGLTQLTVAVQNLSGVTGNTIYKLTGIGLFYLGAASPFTGGLILQATSNWVNGVPTDLSNPGPAGGATWLGGAETSNSPISGYQGLIGCSAGNINVAKSTSTCVTPFQFVFTLTPGANFSLNDIQFAFRGQAWQDVNGTTVSTGSFKCYEGSTTCNPPETAVPEPATLVLLASGLVALSGAQVMRRRKQRRI